MSDYATVTILPQLMARLSSQAPGIVCDIQLIDDAVFRDLAAGKLDFCVLPSNWRLYQSAMPPGIRSAHLYSDDFVCVVDRHNRAVGDTLSVETYLQLPHNMVQLGSGVRSIVEQAWVVNGIAPRVAATTTSFASLVFMIEGTSLIATAQRRLATKFARMLPIRILECPIAVDPLQATLSWHVRHERDPAHRFLRDSFVAAGAAMTDDPQA
jgi:DNA-binding transcriptional LysR family regulator